MRAFAHSLLVVSTLLILTACGGGESLERSDSGTSGANSGSTGGTDSQQNDPVYSVAVETLNADGSPGKDLSQDNVLTVRATVTDQNGTPKTDTLVTFSLSSDDLGTFGNDTATARTDENGIASLTLNVGEAAGDGMITATTADGESGTTTFSSQGTAQISAQPASLNLYTDKVQLPSSGSDSAALTALVKNAQSVLMEGQEVSFSAPEGSGVEIQVDQSATDASGRALATLTTRNNAENRTVQVTARVGELTRTLDVEITGTEVTVNGPKSVILSKPAEMTLRVQDSDGVPVANQTIELSADSGMLSEKSDTPEFANAISVDTQSNGQAIVLYQGTTSGNDIINASALNANTEFKVTVQEDDFAFVNPPEAEIPLNTPKVLTVAWKKEEAAFAGGTVNFTASRGVISSADAVTDSQGNAQFTIQSDNAGMAAITATGQDADGEEVTALVEIEFIATEPAAVITDATPDVLGPDGQTSTITAIVRDAEGNLVKNKVVSFVVDDVSTGSISPSQATTDSNGVASTVFTSGSVSSDEAVTVTATVQDGGIADSVVLTVGNRAFDVSIGTGNQIEIQDSSTYVKEFTVFVTDVGGRPVEGEVLSVSATPFRDENGGEYRQGDWQWISESELWAPFTAKRCMNEDVNNDGILQPEEDFNGDNMLTPGIVGSIGFKDNQNATDNNGQATLQYRYQKEYAAFTDMKIAVFTRSTGSEAAAHTKFTLRIAEPDATNEAIKPPASPFGTGEEACSEIE